MRSANVAMRRGHETMIRLKIPYQQRDQIYKQKRPSDPLHGELRGEVPPYILRKDIEPGWVSAIKEQEALACSSQ